MENVNNKLIYDLGMHLAQDTAYYLHLGYNVVSLDAFPEMITKASLKFEDEVKRGQLKLLNFAMSSNDDDVVEFHISDKSEWNSLRKDISTRQGRNASTILVPTIKLSTIIKEYGLPYYCKIDVEGLDDTCIQTLKELDEIPKFISCETECFSEGQSVTQADVLATLNSLKEVGYTKFKLVEQDDLNSLMPGKSFYRKKNNNSLLSKILRKVYEMTGRNVEKKQSNRELISKQHNYEFQYGATGPFGDDAPGNWMDYDDAKMH